MPNGFYFVLEFNRKFYKLKAIVGQVIFEESVSLMWWLGTVLIIIGLLLMNYGGNKADESKKGPTRRRKCKSR